MKKKNWWSKRYRKWTGKDMLLALLSIGGLGTLLCSLPIVGILIKEALD